MPDRILNPSNGLSKTKLENTTALVSDVLSGKTFYSGDDTLKSGTMVNRGAWSSSVASGASVTIPAGYHNGSGKVTAGGISRMNLITRAPVYDTTGVSLRTTLTGSPTYKCFIMIIGKHLWDKNPSITVTGASYKLLDTLYLEGYGGGVKGTNYLGWMYFIYNLTSSVNLNVYYEPGYDNRGIIVYGIT